MANRYPLIIDTSDNNRIKELPVGDNLNLAGSGIINATSVSVTGAISAQSVTVNGTALATVATSGDYTDLINTPIAFSGSYNDLTNKPTIPTSTRTLTDVQPVEPNDGDILQYNALNGRYQPTPLTATIDIGLFNLEGLSNVIVTGDSSNKFLKYYSGAWRSANVTYGEVQNAPTKLSDLTNDLDLSDFANTPGFISSETDNQQLTFTNGELSISDGNTVVISQMNVTGDLTGSVFADNSTLLIDGVNGKIVGDVEANVYAKDGIALLVDAVNGQLTGPVVTTNITTDSLLLGEGGSINGGIGGLSINPNENLSLEVNVIGNQIIISNDPDALQEDSNIGINAGNVMNITAQGPMTLSSGTGTTTIDANQLDVNSTGVVTIDGDGIELTSSSSQIVLSGPEVSVNSDMIFEDNTTLKIPVYADTGARDTAQPSPYEGSMVWISDISKLQIWTGASWANMN